MEVLTLIEEARAAGLRITLEGDGLAIRGPRAAEPIARALQERKSEVIAALALDQLVGRDTPWRTLCWSDPSAPKIEPFGPPPREAP